MASDVRNVKLGVCNVSYGGVDLGLTKGGVEVSISTETHEVLVDKYGETPVNEFITSRKIEVTVPLAETTLENAIAIMPGATLVVDKEDEGKRRVEIPTGTGLSLLDLAQELILHPILNEAWERQDDLIIYKAATAGEIEYSYKFDEERVFPCKFRGYVDEQKRLFALGDWTATA